ncbi:STAS domain-containing protein [Dactylosporangium sp. CS-033363]|uniref:STAS domain-containing protein n=1 Tax=Dactylosporangium sp. CS-033363 TaxID=3239935 RepID=UPI003D945C85
MATLRREHGAAAAAAGPAMTLAVLGPLDAATEAGCAAVLRRSVAGLSAGQVLIIDLRGCDFLAVAGARVLLDAARRSRARQASCRLLVTPGHEMVRTLERLGVAAAVHLITDAVATGGRS